MDRVFIDRFKDTGWKLINGSVTRSEPVGYCRCNAHKGWMTLKLVNSHECLKKNCPFLDKLARVPLALTETIIGYV